MFKMTKLMEWLCVAAFLGGIWAALVTKQVENEFTEKYMFLIVISPVIFIALFGLYALLVVLYRVFTFNDCEDAAKELQEQILEAKADLTKKGFTFSS